MNLATDILLAVGTVTACIGCAGVLLARDVFRRLHWLGVVTALPTLCFIIAVLLREGLGQAGLKALMILALIVLGGAVLSHATARAAWIRPRGRWSPPFG